MVDSRANTQMKPTRITVEKAIVRLKSFSCLDENTINSRENEKVHERNSREVVPRFVRTKIPAMTNVQECRSEDTGVGPSIASGNQSWVIAVTDLNCIARTKPKSAILDVIPAAESAVIRVIANVETRIRSRTSPARLNPIAEKDDDDVKLRLEKVPMSRKLIRPMDSQPKSRSRRPAELTDSQTEKRKSTNLAVKLRYVGSNSR